MLKRLSKLLTTRYSMMCKPCDLWRVACDVWRVTCDVGRACCICLLIDIVFVPRERPSLSAIFFSMEVLPLPFPVSLITCPMASKCACLLRLISLPATAPRVIQDHCTTCAPAFSTSSAPDCILFIVGHCTSFISCRHLWTRSKVMRV